MLTVLAYLLDNGLASLLK